MIDAQDAMYTNTATIWGCFRWDSYDDWCNDEKPSVSVFSVNRWYMEALAEGGDDYAHAAQVVVDTDSYEFISALNSAHGTAPNSNTVPSADELDRWFPVETEVHPDHLAVNDALAELYPTREFTDAEMESIADMAWNKMWLDFPWWGIYLNEKKVWRLPTLFFAGEWVHRYVTRAVARLDELTASK